MSDTGQLPDSPAKIMLDLLIDRGLGNAHNGVGGWPVYRVNKPQSPDAVIIVQNTAAVQQGKIQTSGRVVSKKGIQITVRDNDYQEVYGKVESIATDLAEDISFPLIFQVGSNYYNITGITRSSGPNDIGTEVEASQRYLFTLNLLLSIVWLEGYTP